MTINGVDHEAVRRNEEASRTQAVEIVLDEGAPQGQIEVGPLLWGGECRIEVDLLAMLQPRGMVQVRCIGRLFEGRGERNNDLEHEREELFTLRRGGIPVKFRLGLRNNHARGGDYATVTMTMTNALVEDDDDAPAEGDDNLNAAAETDSGPGE